MLDPTRKDIASQVSTTAQLAAKLGLSRWSVSRALNGRGGISRATIQRVRQALQDHHFEPDPLARGLRGGRTGLVGVCLPIFSPDRVQRGYDDSALRGLASMDRRLREFAYLPVWEMVCGQPEREWEAVKRLLAMRIQALIMVRPCSPADSPIFKAVLEKRLPVIAVHPQETLPLTTAHSDERQAALLLSKHLDALGHRKCVLLGFGVGERKFQLSAALRQYGIGLQAQVDVSDESRSAGRPVHEVARGHALVGKILAKKLHVGVIIAASDALALGAIRSLRENSRRVPEDCSVASYGNTELAEASLPALTSVDLQTDKLIERSIELLCDQLRSPGRFETTGILINAVLVHRDSVATPGTDINSRAHPI